nr:hypothetical protein GCM10020092_065300 [Actinoplanes digitatis]
MAASTTDRIRELWFATYTVRPSGETATPSGSLPTRMVATAVGRLVLAARSASGTRARAVGAGAAVPRPSTSADSGAERRRDRGGGRGDRRQLALRAVGQRHRDARAAEQGEGGQPGDDHRGAGDSRRTGGAGSTVTRAALPPPTPASA